MKDELKVKEVYYVDGIVFMVVKGGFIIFYELEIGVVRVNLFKLRLREDVVYKVFKFNLFIDGIVVVLKERIVLYFGIIKKEY